MKSGVIETYQNDTDNYIYNPEEFYQYHTWLICEHKGNNTKNNHS